MKRAYLPIVLFGFAIFASACGGGGGSSALPHAGRGNVPQSTGAVVRVVIPKSSNGSSARRPNFIAPNTATIAIGVYTVNGATPSPLPSPISVTIATSPDCTTSGGSTSCTITVTVPVATSVVLQLSNYDAGGNLLGQALIGPINTTLATIPTQSVSVGGVPAKILLSAAGLAAGDDGSTHTVTFGVYAEDADNNIIVPPGTYPNPISLTMSGDTNGALSLSTTSVASPGPTNGATAVTLTYNSAKAITQATLTATSGSATASIPFAPIVFTPTTAALYLSGSPQSVTVSEAGYAGAFSPSGSSTTASVTCVPTNCTPSSAGGTVTINIAPGTTSGSETVSVVDANGGFANIPVTVTTTTGGGALVGAPQIHEFATTSGGTNFGIAVGPDGQTLWFLDRANGMLGSVASPGSCTTSCGTITEQQSPFVIASGPPLPVGLQSITAASDGNLYITDVGNTSSSDSGGELWQVTCTSASSCNTGNNISMCCSSTPQPDAVLAAPDGNLYVGLLNPGWTGYGEMLLTQVAGCCTSGMGGINISGPSSGSAVGGMAVDASGQNLWFTDSGTTNIGVFPIPCNNCTVSEMPSGSTQTNLPAARHRPLTSSRRIVVQPPKKRNIVTSGFTGPLTGIVSGPDGNLYVADQGAHTIDQISPSTCVGTSCPYTAITLNGSALPMNLIVGPDGNIWFTDTGGYIGVISMRSCASGTCTATEYHVGGAPWGIAAGPDGDIWFTDSSTNAIGKVVLQ